MLAAARRRPKARSASARPARADQNLPDITAANEATISQLRNARAIATPNTAYRRASLGIHAPPADPFRTATAPRMASEWTSTNSSAIIPTPSFTQRPLSSALGHHQATTNRAAIVQQVAAAHSRASASPSKGTRPVLGSPAAAMARAEADPPRGATRVIPRGRPLTAGPNRRHWRR